MEAEQSPYDPPASDIETASVEPADIVPASRKIRLANFAIDYSCMLVLVIALMIAPGIIAGEETLDFVNTVPDLVFGVILVSIYYLPQEALTGRTLGKLITGTRVVTAQGLRPAFRHVLGRTLTRMVPFEPLSFLGREGRGWHDRWPGTYVVKCR